MWGWRHVNISKHDHKPVIFGIVNLWDVLKKDSCRLESQLSSFSREGGGRDTTSQSDNGSHSPSIREGTLAVNTLPPATLLWTTGPIGEESTLRYR